MYYVYIYVAKIYTLHCMKPEQISAIMIFRSSKEFFLCNPERPLYVGEYHKILHFFKNMNRKPSQIVKIHKTTLHSSRDMYICTKKANYKFVS